MRALFHTKIFDNDKRVFKAGLLFCITIAAMILRLQPSPQEKIRDGFGQFGDTFVYHKIAYNLYKGNGFSAAYDAGAFGMTNETHEVNYEPAVTRGPIYPLFMTMVYKIFGNNQTIENWENNWNKVRIIQCILDSLLCLIVYFLVRLIIPGSSIPAIIASLLYCLSLYNIYYTKALLTESITTFLVTCFLFLALLALKSPLNKRKIVYAGMLIGMVVLTRPEYLLFIPLFAFYLYYYSREHKKSALKRAVLFIAAAFILISPWSARNYIVFKKPIIVAVSGLGYSLFLGTFEGHNSWEGWGKYPKTEFTEKQHKIIKKLQTQYRNSFYEGSIKIEEIDNAFMEIAFYRINKQPFEIMKLWLKRWPRLWYQNYIQMYAIPEPSPWLFRFYFFLSLFAIILSAKKERVVMIPIILLFIYISGIFLPLHIEPRYGVPVMPGIICLTGIGIWKLAKCGNGCIVKVTQKYKKNIG